MYLTHHAKPRLNLYDARFVLFSNTQDKCRGYIYYLYVWTWPTRDSRKRGRITKWISSITRYWVMEKVAVVVMVVVEVVWHHYYIQREISWNLHTSSNEILFSKYYLSVVKVSLSLVIYIYIYMYIFIYIYVCIYMHLFNSSVLCCETLYFKHSAKLLFLSRTKFK